MYEIALGALLESGFWQINFWGLLGAITGVGGLVISWLGYRYARPKIKIGHPYLVTNMCFLKCFKTGKFEDGTYFKIYVYFHAFNANLGPGSFERPTLRMYTGDELVLRLFPDYDGEDDRIIYLNGGQGKKVVQTYTFRFEEHRDDRLFEKMFKWEDAKPIHYEILYLDNLGIEHTIKNLQDHEPNKEAMNFFDTEPRLIHQY